MRWSIVGAVLTAVLCCGSANASPRTVESVIGIYGADARSRLAPYFAQLPQSLSPKAAKFIAVKAEKRLEIWLQDADNAWHHLRDYPIEKASGSLRPKMRQGDMLVPEGVYQLDAANPNSKFHLSLRINYPNSLDRYYGELEQRDDLGGDIFIHGRDVSTGCLAIGDPSIEELFVLSHDIGLENIEVVISPTDPRDGILERQHGVPEWVEQKYQRIEQSVAELQANRPLIWY
ncbi:L,D-transpeptidase family protein [Ferrimonas senticii]|uniref:L,D-transpeptidase family protein n=1 Tax=Ferrimonas senticii TaxID=394566 RepID=UPI0004044B08|nr:L,D-transpeptidase family protein [Ferrimonas senticii]